MGREGRLFTRWESHDGQREDIIKEKIMGRKDISTPYHSGELTVQTRAGVRVEASRIANMITSSLPPVARAFLLAQRLAVGSTVGRDGRVWASLLTGVPGFLQAMDEISLLITAPLLPDDPLIDDLSQGGPLGLLAIDLGTRKRIRVNGQATLQQGGIVMRTEQVYFNCPKYIQSRHLTFCQEEHVPPSSGSRIQQLSPRLQAWLQQVDTFFIASVHPQRGADASHRGGFPGFLQVLDARHLAFPDYAGNMMFQTLGNLVVNPHVGLLFVNFETGDILQLTGTAHITWQEGQITTLTGAERLITFEMEEGREILAGCPLRGQLAGYSPFIPM